MCNSPYWNKPKWKGVNVEKTGEVLEKLMTFIYDQYNSSDTFKSHGEHASVILIRFTRESGIRLGNARAQLEYMRLLKKRGWIEVASVDSISKPGPRLFSFSRIKPTLEGINHVEERRQPGQALFKATSTEVELIGRGLKGFLGK